jgi:peptidoglycan hydrolase CwlO-like protein
MAFFIVTAKKTSNLTYVHTLYFLLQSYGKTIQEIQKQLDDLEKQISKLNKENKWLNTKITDINIDIHEHQLLRDLEFESRQTDSAKQR